MKTLTLLIFAFLLGKSLFANTAYTGMRNITSLELTADMAPGLNLHNALESISDVGPNTKKRWRQPKTTLEMVNGFATKWLATSQTFNEVRHQCTSEIV